MKKNKYKTFPNIIIKGSILLILLLIGFMGYSQELKQTSKNVLDENTIVYTYSSSNNETMSIKDNENLTIAIEDISTLFYSIENVIRSSFDAATGLITVVGNTQSNLPILINSNQIKSHITDSGEKRYYYQKEKKLY